MAKKKNTRQKQQKEACEEDTSDEELKSYSSEKLCPHIAKAVNLSRMKKALKANHDLEKCKDCGKPNSNEVPSDVAAETESNDMWLCLQCGYCGCSRNSTNQHALLHFKTPRSDCHSLVVNTSTLCIWCYMCDDSVHGSSRALKECMEFITKNRSKKGPVNLLVNGSAKNIVKPVVTEKAEQPSTEVAHKAEKSSVAPRSKLSDASLKPANSGKKHVPSNLRSIKGLRNLGNTCFFNAVLQNMCQTPWLLEELERRSEKGYVWEIPFPVSENESVKNVENPLKAVLLECGPLTQSFYNFLKQMKKRSTETKAEVYNPQLLFDQICKKAPQFRGFHEQDSHELLRHLLDGIRNEEIKRQKKAILRAFKLSEKINPDEVDENTKQLIKAYGSFASHTIAERIFGGQLLSTVVCEECKVSSQVFEPFMDLSLPLTEERAARSGKQKQTVNEDGMHSLSKKKGGDNSVSRHQEKKIKQQARKAAKKRAKFTETDTPEVEEQKEDGESAKKFDEQESTSENNSVDMNQDESNLDKEQNLNHEQSDADVEDNDENENATNSLCRTKNEDNDVFESVGVDGHAGSGEPGSMDNRIEELCSQITDIRIRQDSDKQEDLLDCMDDDDSPKKLQRPLSCSMLSSISDEVKYDEWSHPQSEQQTKEWVKQSLSTLTARYQPVSLECSVKSCLNQFTASELLTGSNKFRCENCTVQKQKATGDEKVVVYSNASKQLLIFSPPTVLTLHLKRFQQTGMSLRKLNLFVEFPEILDLAPYCSSLCLRLPHMTGIKDEVLYSLYGVVQHSGRLTSGHYTAYIKVRDTRLNPVFLNTCPTVHCNVEQLLDKISKVKINSDVSCSQTEGSCYKWYYVSDSFSKEVTEAEVLRCQAYILFYERIK